MLEAPEGDSWLALVDVKATDADAAVAEAWAAYKPAAKWPLKAVMPAPDKDGWQGRKTYVFQTSPNERREVSASVMRHEGRTTVAIYDMSDATGEKRGAAVALVLGRLLPKDYSRESFAGKRANVLDEARLKELGAFVERGREWATLTRPRACRSSCTTAAA